MAQSKGLCCGLFRGTIYLKDLSDPNAALLSIGNSELDISPSVEEISVDNFESLGGKACFLPYINSVRIQMNNRCAKPENLAKAFLGEAFQKTGNSVFDEEHVANDVNELIPLENVPAPESVVVTNEGGQTTYTVNEDYIVTSAGIKILESTSMVLPETLKISYEYGENWTIDALTTSQKEYLMVLDGVNVGANGSRAVVLKAHRVKLAPTDTFTVIGGTDFASINFTGEILRDESKPSGSKFFNIEFGAEVQSQY